MSIETNADNGGQPVDPEAIRREQDRMSRIAAAAAPPPVQDEEPPAPDPLPPLPPAEAPTEGPVEIPQERSESAAPEGTPSFLAAAYETAGAVGRGEIVLPTPRVPAPPPSPGSPPLPIKSAAPIPRPIDMNMAAVPEAGNSAKDRELLDRISVDLTHITLVDSNKIQRSNYVEAALRSDAAYQVIALRSGYTAGMGGLTFLDKDSLRNSNLDNFNERKRLYQITYQKMVHTSVGPMTFSEFLAVTAFDDLETLLFGVYCQTYPNATEFTITCGKCGKPCQIQVHPTSFVKAYDKKDVYSYINEEFLARKHEPMDLLGQSLVHSYERILLPESKIIVDIRTPSLQDHLDTLGRYDEQAMKSSHETFGCMVYIDQILVPNIQVIRATGKAAYTRLEDFDEKFRTVCGLRDDGDVLNGAVNRREKKFAIDYSISSIPCSGCKEQMGEIPINIERLLYFQMEESRRRAEMEKVSAPDGSSQTSETDSTSGSATK
jgi:hypothetical protein